MINYFIDELPNFALRQPIPANLSITVDYRICASFLDIASVVGDSVVHAIDEFKKSIEVTCVYLIQQSYGMQLSRTDRKIMVTLKDYIIFPESFEQPKKQEDYVVEVKSVKSYNVKAASIKDAIKEAIHQHLVLSKSKGTALCVEHNGEFYDVDGFCEGCGETIMNGNGHSYDDVWICNCCSKGLIENQSP